MKEYLFAYGTLLDRHAASEVAPVIERLKPVGRGYIFARLYDLGEYPGAILDRSQRHKVFGRIFELPVDTGVLERLDAYEGFNPRNRARNLFVRKRTMIKRPNRRSLHGWVYVYNRDVNSSPIIQTGKYSKASA
jgi:gamma-glutamylcyclotransferase (GGCT)/AIG2-like uncharacterized protein YtfP